MGSVTVSVDEDVATRQSPAYGAGLGDHLPIGYWSGAKYRSAIRFDKPAGWTGWSAVTKAELTVWISDHAHVGVRNSGVYVRKQLSTNLWTKGAGTQDCESGFSAGNNTQYDDLTPTTGSQLSFASGTTATVKKTINVTSMVEWYRDMDAKPVFVFDPQGTDDYTELWSNNSPSNAQDPKLTIWFEESTPPLAPTLNTPASGAVVPGLRPVFGWTPNNPSGLAQSAATVGLYTSAGVLIREDSLLAPHGYTWPNDLVAGTTYLWTVRTADAAGGYGPNAAKKAFTIASGAAPFVATLDTTRVMGFRAGGPRLKVSWSFPAGFVQDGYRILAGSESSAYHVGTEREYWLDATTLVDNVAVPITVEVTEHAGGVVSSTSRTFTPRFGLSTHRTNLGNDPTAWVSASFVPASLPTGSQIVVEFAATDTGSTPAAGDWKQAIDDVAKEQYLWYRVWLIPSATASPSLDSVTVVSDRLAGTQDLDKWSTSRSSHVFAAPWSVDDGQYVYGTRSAHVTVAATSTDGYALYSQEITLRANRSYILSALMRSQGNSGAHVRLEETNGGALTGGGVIYPSGSPMQTKVLTEDSRFYNDEKFDVVRYDTPVFKPASDTLVRVVLAAGKTGAAVGAQAWFDGVKLEESTVATPWSPGALGATVVDAGGVQIDGSEGGVLRYRGSNYLANSRAVVGGGANGLLFAGDTELDSPSVGVLAINGVPIGSGGGGGTSMVYEYDTASNSGADVAVSATTAAGATVLVTGNPVTYDGATSVQIEVECPAVITATGQAVRLVLFDNGVMAIDTIGWAGGSSGTSSHTLRASVRVTPPAGVHTFSIRAYSSSGTATFYRAGNIFGASSACWFRVVATAAVPVLPAAPDPVQGGSVSVAGITNTTSGSSAVTFPRPYASAPVVTVGSPSTQVGVSVTAITGSGCTISARRLDGVATAYTGTFMWMAIGTLA